MRASLGYPAICSAQLDRLYNKGGCWKSYVPYDSHAATLEVSQLKFQQAFYGIVKPIIVDYDSFISHAIDY